MRSILTITDDDPKLGLDASDALATALCHAHRQSRGARTQNYKDWSAFLRDNPGRVTK